MKNFNLFFLFGLFLFAGCSEEKSINEVDLIIEEVDYSEVVRVFDETKENFVDVKFTSTDKSALKAGIESHNLHLILNASNKSVSSVDSLCFEEQLSDFGEIYEDDLAFNDIDELSIEVISQSFQDETDYTLSFRAADTKLLKTGYPPTRYYFKYKAKIKRKYLGVKYFPVEDDNSGIYFHWTRTNCWLCRWRGSEGVWVQGHVFFEWEMAHPDNNRGYYRLGVGLYSNNPSNFDIKESDNPIVW